MKKEHFKKLTSVSCKKVAGGTLLIIALWIQYIAPDFEKRVGYLVQNLMPL